MEATMSTITYTTEQLKDLEFFLMRLSRGNTYDLFDISIGDVHTPLITARSMITMSGRQCQFFHENFKKEVEHKKSIYAIGDGPCHWESLYDILFVYQLRELPTKIHHFFGPIIKWRLENGI
jgi:hypothetical protein